MTFEIAQNVALIEELMVVERLWGVKHNAWLETMSLDRKRRSAATFQQPRDFGGTRIAWTDSGVKQGAVSGRTITLRD